MNRIIFLHKKAMQMTNGDDMILKQGNICKVTVELKKEMVKFGKNGKMVD